MDVVIPAIAGDVQEVEILALLVRVGQHVLAEQPVLEVEAGKASFELPCPATGKIEEIRVGIGDDVKVGDVVLTLRTMEDGKLDPPAPLPTETSETRETSETSETRETKPRATCVRASPAARRRARELGVDLDALAAEFDGHVTVEQVEARAGGAPDPAEVVVDDVEALPLRSDPDPWIADWRGNQHNALHQTIDITSLEAARRRYRDAHELSSRRPAAQSARRSAAEFGPRLTLTAFVLKACAIALRQHPRMNSSLLRHGRALAIKRYVHIAVAVNTRRGLALPVLTHVDQRPLCQLADELERLARAEPMATEQVEAPTFSITNLRSFGGTGFDPLRFNPTVHPPQVGALGMCRARTEAGRTLLPVSLAYDPRVNDEAAASSFLATIAELLHDPMAMLMRA